MNPRIVLSLLAVGLTTGALACNSSRAQTHEGHTTTTSASNLPVTGHAGHGAQPAASAAPGTPPGVRICDERHDSG